MTEHVIRERWSRRDKTGTAAHAPVGFERQRRPLACPAPTKTTHIGRRRQRQVECLDLVPVEPFQAAFLELRSRGEMTVGQLCREMGWTYMRSKEGWPSPDTSLALRNLGLRPHSTSGAARTVIPYKMAERLCQVFGMDPHEAGI